MEPRPSAYPPSNRGFKLWPRAPEASAINPTKGQVRFVIRDYVNTDTSAQPQVNLVIQLRACSTVGAGISRNPDFP
jgi:hypothetical protein